MNQDTHGSNAEEWIGFDLDGTLAKYDGWKGIEHIGEPVASMVVIAKMLHRLGKKIKILTARVAPRDDGKGGEEAKKYVEAWCKKNLGFVPEITYEKDASMAALFDDRAVAVEQNTGKVLGGWPDFLPKASEKAKKAVLRNTEKKASAKIDIPALYEEIRRAYSEMGYPVSGDRLVLSEQPTYVDGRPVPADVISPNESGGNTQHDGTVRINPRYRAVMRHWGIKGPGRDFLRTIIGHEVGHHIDRTVFGDRPDERSRLLQEIAKAKFHTVYTDSYGPDTDPRKLDKELLAEYLAAMVKKNLEKKAEYTRYSSDSTGIYQAMKNSMSDDEWRKFLSDGDVNWLRKPSHYPKGATSWFTEEGDKKFIERVLPMIAKRIRAERIKKETTSDPGSIVYKDDDQIVSVAEKSTSASPSNEDLRRMYDIIQADARLSDKVSKLGFGNSGDAYRRAAIKLKIMELASVLKDGKKIRNNIVHRPGYIPSERDSERAIAQYAGADSRLSELLGKKAEIDLKDGKYRDVKKIYDALTDVEKDFITPGRTEYKDVPTWARTVAYDEKDPVGFADAYGRKHSANLCIAVSDAARGKRLARAMAYETMKKILDQIKKRREEAEQEGGRSLREFNRLPELKKFIWDVKKENIPSALAAEHAGFKEKHVPSRKWRRFVMKRRDAENLL